MALMKEMVKDVMSAPMALNEKSVASKCLANDIVQLREEEATLREHLEEGGRAESLSSRDQGVRADARLSDAVTSESGTAPKCTRPTQLSRVERGRVSEDGGGEEYARG